MNRRNKLFLGLWLMGIIAIIIGAIHKVNGNEHAYIALITGMFMKIVAVIALISYN